jgi:hypothetical protein
MKKISFLLAMLLPTVVFAAGSFDGTWKADLKSIQFSSKPDVFELKQGTYKCSTCVPAYTVKADGTDQKVSGYSYFDTIAVQEVDPKTVQITTKLAGKVMHTDTIVISDDGKTSTNTFKDMSGAQAVTGTGTMKRVAAGAPGSHAISGSWKSDKLPEYSDTGLTFAYKTTDNGLQMTWNGQSYDAKFDGKKYLMANDPGKTWVSIKKLSDNAIEETDTNDGKVTGISKSTVSADGKTIAVVFTDPRRGTTMKYTLIKQP